MNFFRVKQIKKNLIDSLESMKRKAPPYLFRKKSKQQRQEYKLSFFTVGLKLLLINSCIIILTLSLMIWLATYFFIKEYKLRIEEQNIKITEVIGYNLEFSISGFIKQSRMIKENSKLFLGSMRQEIVYIGLYEMKEGSLNSIEHNGNYEYLKRVHLSSSQINSIVESNKTHFKQAFTKSLVLMNLNTSTGVPLLALAFPEKENASTRKIIFVLCPVQLFLNAFHADTGKLVQTSMVDASGRLLIHTDIDLLQLGRDKTQDELIEAMQKSRFRSGQIGYHIDSQADTLNQESKIKQEHYIGSFWKSNWGNFAILATVKEEDAFAEVFNIQRRNIFLMISALNIAILALFLYAKRMVKPIQELTVAARKISNGNYKVHLPVHAHRVHDEIDLLSKTFELMSKGLQERENLKETLGRVTNKEIAKRSLHKSLELGGENKNVAILFSDVRNFTSMSEKMKPSQVMNFLNSYFSVMVECVVENNGVVDKFLGDALMAHWGALEKVKNPIALAVQTSLDMRLALGHFNKDRKEKVHIGIGINYGAVVSGQMGSKQRLEHTVIGDSVNVASRLEGLSKNFKVDIVISEDIYKHSKDIIDAVPLGTTRVKGKIKKIKVYAVLGKKGDPNTPKNLYELRKLVGLGKV